MSVLAELKATKIGGIKKLIRTVKPTPKKPLSLLELDDDQVSVLVQEVVESWNTQFSEIAYDPAEENDR